MGTCVCWPCKNKQKPILTLDYDRLEDDYGDQGPEPLSYSQYIQATKENTARKDTPSPRGPTACSL
jgi:hypothetical protein